jgi:VCBS repeat-containing protein
MANLIGQQLGNYRLVRLLGQGGFADVYLAEHIHLDSQAAIKVLQMRLVGSALEQFRNEGRIIASLAHPNIVRVFDFDVEDGTPFLVMDYAPNGTLRQRYPKGSVLSAVSILPHFRQVALALQYAHDRKLIHRDIKPENMLLGANGEVLLSDFGLVLLAQSTGSQTAKEMAGTLPYMAPEQINGKPRSASDQYALGIVLYEWLSGDRPFRGSLVEIATQHLMTPPPPLYGKVPGVSLAIQEVVFTALAKEPLQRFASMQEFATALENVSQAELHSSSSLPTVTGISVPVENTSSYPSSAPTYIKIPSSEYPQPSTVMNTPGHAQPPVITPQNYSQLPTVANMPSSPEQPLVLPTKPGQLVQPSGPSSVSQPVMPIGEADRGWIGGQPTIPAMSNTPPTPIISSEGYQTPRGRKGRVGLIIVSLLLLITLVVGGVAYAMPGPFSSLVNTILGRTSSTTPPVPTTSATVTITPASTDLKNTYTISAVTGKPDAAQHQVGARLLSVTTQTQSKTVNATGQGTTPGTHATGELIVYNCDTVNPVNLSAGSAITNTYSDGGAPSSLVIVTDTSIVNLPPGNPPSNCTSIIIPGHVQQIGTFGNFPAYKGASSSINSPNTPLGSSLYVLSSPYSPNFPNTSLSGGPSSFGHLYGSCSGYCWAVFNNGAFTGGTDPQPYTIVAQSDIDNAVNSINQPDAQQTLQGEIHPNERLVATPSCKSHVQSNHKAGDQATSVTVTVSYTCTGEVYDQDGVLAAAAQWLKDDAARSPGAGYVLIGKVKTTSIQAQIVDANQGTVSISINAEGIWVFQFNNDQKAQLAHLLAGKSKSDAQVLLQNQQGVKQFDIQFSGNGTLFPNDPGQITIVVRNVTGL